MDQLSLASYVCEILQIPPFVIVMMQKFETKTFIFYFPRLREHILTFSFYSEINKSMDFCFTIMSKSQMYMPKNLHRKQQEKVFFSYFVRNKSEFY